MGNKTNIKNMVRTLVVVFILISLANTVIAATIENPVAILDEQSGIVIDTGWDQSGRQFIWRPGHETTWQVATSNSDTGSPVLNAVVNDLVGKNNWQAGYDDVLFQLLQNTNLNVGGTNRPTFEGEIRTTPSPATGTGTPSSSGSSQLTPAAAQASALPTPVPDTPEAIIIRESDLFIQTQQQSITNYRNEIPGVEGEIRTLRSDISSLENTVNRLQDLGEGDSLDAIRAQSQLTQKEQELENKQDDLNRLRTGIVTNQGLIADALVRKQDAIDQNREIRSQLQSNYESEVERVNTLYTEEIEHVGRLFPNQEFIENRDKTFELAQIRISLGEDISQSPDQLLELRTSDLNEYNQIMNDNPGLKDRLEDYDTAKKAFDKNEDEINRRTARIDTQRDTELEELKEKFDEDINERQATEEFASEAEEADAGAEGEEESAQGSTRIENGVLITQSTVLLRDLPGGYELDVNPGGLGAEAGVTLTIGEEGDPFLMPHADVEVLTARARASARGESISAEQTETLDHARGLLVLNDPALRAQAGNQDRLTKIATLQKDLEALKKKAADKPGDAEAKKAVQDKNQELQSEIQELGFEAKDDAETNQKLDDLAHTEELHKDYGNPYYGRSKAQFKIGHYLTLYKDRSALSNALFGDAWLNDWTLQVDEAFAKSYMGVDYWVSEICMDEFDVVGDSTAYVLPPSGIPQLIATVNGEVSDKVPMLCGIDPETGDGNYCQEGTCRSEDQLCVNENNEIVTEFFYKISVGVTSPADDTLTPYVNEDGAVSFNIFVTGREKSAFFFDKPIEMENGQVFKNIFAQYSPFKYNKVCIQFIKPAVSRDGSEIKKICNNIVTSQKSYINSANNPADAAAVSSGVPAAYCTTCW